MTFDNTGDICTFLIIVMAGFDNWSMLFMNVCLNLLLYT